MEFKIGQFYTRAEISQQLGGDPISYLPRHLNRIVCGCFTLELNPNAPKEILAGSELVVADCARMLLKQGGSIPVFIKIEELKWEFRGNYQVKGAPEVNPAVLQQKAIEAGRLDTKLNIEKLSMAFHLEKVE